MGSFQGKACLGMYLRTNPSTARGPRRIGGGVAVCAIIRQRYPVRILMTLDTGCTANAIEGEFHVVGNRLR